MSASGAGDALRRFYREHLGEPRKRSAEAPVACRHPGCREHYSVHAHVGSGMVLGGMSQETYDAYAELCQRYPVRLIPPDESASDHDAEPGRSRTLKLEDARRNYTRPKYCTRPDCNQCRMSEIGRSFKGLCIVSGEAT